MRDKTKIMAGLMILLVSPMVCAWQQTTQKSTDDPLNQAVSRCVEQVRNHRSGNPSEQPLFSGFDAYYNPATGQIESNAEYNGNYPAQFLFEKCMSGAGFPFR